jgi:hypothetical protein
VSTITCKLADHAAEVRREADRISALCLVMSPASLEDSLRVIRLNVAAMTGIGKCLAESVPVQSGGVPV